MQWKFLYLFIYLLAYLSNSSRYQGCIVWFTGLSGSGKSTLAYTVEHALVSRGKLACVLDGDNIRHGLCSNLTFTKEGKRGGEKEIEAAVYKSFLEGLRFYLFLFIIIIMK